MGYKIDLKGQRFGRLTVLEYFDTQHRMSRWKCRCDCGKEVIMYANHMRTGAARSCGCLAAEYRRNKPEAVKKAKIANTTHGGTKDRLFKIWISMRSRCSDVNHPAYKWYGGKGVRVCDEWQDYQTFKEWAYANGYDDQARKHECSIDRINPNGDYCPENCRWADVKTQAENRSGITLYEYGGERGTLNYFALKYGVHPDTLRWRVKRLGWPIEKALTAKAWECNRKGVEERGTGSV